jgi:hypothetical protein
MTPFSFPLDRPDVHLSDLPEGISVSAEAAARVLTQAAKRIRSGESVRDVCEGLVDVVIALSGRI